MSHHEDVAKCRAAAQHLETLRREGSLPGCISVSIGFKYVNGERTDQIAVIVGVKKKLSPEELRSQGITPVPATVEGAPTDVIEDGGYEALVLPDVAPELDLGAQALTQKRRPTPGGYSCGHPGITAGTLGAWVRRGNESTS